jgi:hypothetical protein
VADSDLARCLALLQSLRDSAENPLARSEVETNLGMVLEEKGRLEEAAEAYRRVCADDFIFVGLTCLCGCFRLDLLP